MSFKPIISLGGHYYVFIWFLFLPFLLFPFRRLLLLVLLRTLLLIQDPNGKSIDFLLRLFFLPLSLIIYFPLVFLCPFPPPLPPFLSDDGWVDEKSRERRKTAL